jgi:hypothetical protein
MAARMSLVRRIGCVAEMARHFLRTRVERAPDAYHLAQAPPDEVPLLRLSDARRGAADADEAERAAHQRRAA